jgi:hypothetical protein
MDEKVKKKVDTLIREMLTLPEEALENFRVFNSRHSYSARLDGHHSVRSLFGLSACSKVDLLVVSGRDTTDRSGKATLPIHQLLCGATAERQRGEGRLALVREPQFVVTPISQAPLFATYQSRSTPGSSAGIFVEDRDGNMVSAPYLASLEIEVMMWKHDGAAAGEANFSWICMLEAGRIIPFG